MSRDRHLPEFCGSAEVSAAYPYARPRTIIKVTEHILEVRFGGGARTRTFALLLPAQRNGVCGFEVTDGLVDPPGRGLEPFYPDVSRPPSFLERGLLPGWHGFLQVNLPSISEPQSRPAHVSILRDGPVYDGGARA